MVSTVISFTLVVVNILSMRTLQRAVGQTDEVNQRRPLQITNVTFFAFLFLIQLSYIYCWATAYGNLLLFGCVRIIMEMLINYVFLSVLSYFGTAMKI